MDASNIQEAHRTLATPSRHIGNHWQSQNHWKETSCQHPWAKRSWCHKTQRASSPEKGLGQPAQKPDRHDHWYAKEPNCEHLLPARLKQQGEHLPTSWCQPSVRQKHVIFLDWPGDFSQRPVRSSIFKSKGDSLHSLPNLRRESSSSMPRKISASTSKWGMLRIPLWVHRFDTWVSWDSWDAVTTWMAAISTVFWMDFDDFGSSHACWVSITSFGTGCDSSWQQLVFPMAGSMFQSLMSMSWCRAILVIHRNWALKLWRYAITSYNIIFIYIYHTHWVLMVFIVLWSIHSASIATSISRGEILPRTTLWNWIVKRARCALKQYIFRC